jgi:hypothetical protein
MFAADNPTFLSKMAQAGVSGFTVPPVERIETQRHELQTMLSFDHVAPLHEFNRPTWYFASHCENAIRGIIRHYWDIDRLNKKAKESEQYKDMVDPHRYRLAAWGGQPRYDATRTRQFRISEAARLAGKPASRTREEFYQGIPVFHGTQGL